MENFPTDFNIALLVDGADVEFLFLDFQSRCNKWSGDLCAVLVFIIIIGTEKCYACIYVGVFYENMVILAI